MVDYCVMPAVQRLSNAPGVWARLEDSTARVRGRWVISWQAYTIGAILHIVLVGATGGSLGAEPTTPEQTPYWLLLAMIATGLVGGYALVVNYTLFGYKRSRLVPLSQAIAFHIGVGCIFAATLLIGSRRVPVAPIEGAIGFSIATIAIGVWFGFTMSFLLQARERYHSDRADLIEQTVTTELTSIAETEAVAKLTSNFTTDVASSLSELDPLQDELQDRLEKARRGEMPVNMDASWRAVAFRLREASEQAVRPLSRELWAVTAERFPNPNWREVLLDTLRSPIAWPLPSALIVVIGYLRAATSSFGLVPGIAVTVTMAAVIGCLLLFVQRIEGPRSRGFAFWSAFAVAQALGLGVVLLSPGSPSQSAINEMFSSVVAMTISILAPAAISTLNGARNGVLSRLRSHASRERITQIAQGRLLARLARDTATHLHGTVQTSLIACAAAIELAADAQDPDQLIAAIERAIDIVATIDRSSPSHDLTLRETLTGTASAWDGLVDVRTEIAPLVAALRGPTTHSVGRVVEECLTNAVRHGDASEVHIRIQPRDGVLEIVVEDDGRGMDSSIPAHGLGTTLLVETTQGRVTYEPRHPGTERPGLRVRALIDLLSSPAPSMDT